jgi:Tfp pilus assembly protein FimT
MLEIVMVLMITGIVAALAYPKIDVGRYKADSVVTTVRSAMQQAQRASLVGQHDVMVSFDVTNRSIRILWDANNDHQVNHGERMKSIALGSGNQFATPTRGLRGTVSQPVVGSNVKSVDNLPTVTFHRDGSLSSDLEIYMSTISTPTRWRAVTVVQSTGRTDWFRKGMKDNNWVAGVL